MSACLTNAIDGVFKEIITIFIFSVPSLNGLKSFWQRLSRHLFSVKEHNVPKF